MGHELGCTACHVEIFLQNGPDCAPGNACSVTEIGQTEMAILLDQVLDEPEISCCAPCPWSPPSSSIFHLILARDKLFVPHSDLCFAHGCISPHLPQ